MTVLVKVFVNLCNDVSEFESPDRRWPAASPRGELCSLSLQPELSRRGRRKQTNVPG